MCGFSGGGSSSPETLAHTHNQALANDGGDLSETLTDMNGVPLYSLITDNSAAVAANTANIAINTAAIAALPPAGLTAQEVNTEIYASRWVARTAASTSAWNGMAWSPELGIFCALSSSDCMTSPDGNTWTTRTVPNHGWSSIVWSSDQSQFVGVAENSNGVMTSPDGITWTNRTDPNTNFYMSVTYSPSLTLFCSVARTGTGDRVATTPDGITWTTRTSAEDNTWKSVTWSEDLTLFAAVSSDGTNRVMTSPDGITWTARAAAVANSWQSVVWSPEIGIFCAVSNTGTGDRIMTSPDGITWTTQTSPASSRWECLAWSPELYSFAAASDTEPIGEMVMQTEAGTCC
mgnify:CR=1 FL=1